MKTANQNVKYVEWRSTEEMHAKTLQWISELEFAKTEQHFLEELIEENTLNILSGNIFSQSKELVTHLSKTETKVNALLPRVKSHNNDLDILVKSEDSKQVQDHVKETHYEIEAAVMSFLSDFKELKTDIFNLIKTIIKKNKQRRLLE